MTTATRVFIIGDDKHGLTVVITDPVAVFHYSPDDLRDKNIVTAAAGDEKSVMAGVVRELIPILRGNNLDLMEDSPGLFDAGALATELENARSIAAQVKSGTAVHQVDFCLAFEIDTKKSEAFIRKFDPARSVANALTNGKGGSPQQPKINKIDDPLPVLAQKP